MPFAETFIRYAPPRGARVELPRIPPKTTFGGAGSHEGRRITAYMEEIAPLLQPLFLLVRSSGHPSGRPFVVTGSPASRVSGDLLASPRRS
jgi:hypothetical protein